MDVLGAKGKAEMEKEGKKVRGKYLFVSPLSSPNGMLISVKRSAL